MTLPWRIKGEFLLSCNCEVFCPCVISLGRARPTEGPCYSWWAIHIDEGNAGDEKLDDTNVAMFLEVPGPLAEGNWTLGLYVEEGADAAAVDALTKIFTGEAGGQTGWFSIMTANFLGTKQVPISFEKEGKGWRVEIPKIIGGSVEPLERPGGDGPTMVTNSAYWVAPEVVVSTGTRSRVRDWGRNWDLSGKSAEYARIEWSGP